MSGRPIDGVELVWRLKHCANPLYPTIHEQRMWRGHLPKYGRVKVLARYVAWRVEDDFLRSLGSS